MLLAGSHHATLADIARLACHVGGVGMKELRGPRRLHRIVAPRQGFMAAAVDYGYTYSEVGEYCGGRDHSTAIFAMRSVKDDLEMGLGSMRARVYVALCEELQVFVPTGQVMPPALRRPVKTIGRMSI